MYSKFYKAMLIKTKVVVEISLDKESDLAGFKEQIWQLINSCLQLMKFV